MKKLLIITIAFISCNGGEGPHDPCESIYQKEDSVQYLFDHGGISRAVYNADMAKIDSAKAVYNCR